VGEREKFFSVFERDVFSFWEREVFSVFWGRDKKTVGLIHKNGWRERDER
jgi:hypothetical protein